MSRSNDPTLSERLRNVYWIGGGSGAGKSTTARCIAARYGLSVYSTDDAMGEHARRSSREDCPLLHRFMAMDMDERWLNRTPATMLETFHWFNGEAFGMIIDDLLRLPMDAPVIVEGFRLLPRLVKPLLATPRHAVWLLPTPEFRRAVMEDRARSPNGFLNRTSDPPKALVNLLERDCLFTDMLRREAQRLDLPTVDVDVTMTEEELAHEVSARLSLNAT